MTDASAQNRDDLDSVLRDWRWLGELSRRLLADPALAEDAQQAVWVDAQRAGPKTRAQLYWAMRRFIGGVGRGDRRRARRERTVARDEALPDASELLERGEQQRRVWEALRCLKEPYRQTLLLHFQDGLTAREIAERSGELPNTVRHRIRRGVELLRTALAADEGGGGLHGLALAVPGIKAGLHPIASTPCPTFNLTSACLSPAALGGALLMTKLFLTVAASLAAIYFLTRPSHPGPAPDDLGKRSEVETASPPLAALPEAADGRTPVAIAPDSGQDAAPPSRQGMAVETPTLLGRIVVHGDNGQILPGSFDGELWGTFMAERSGFGVPTQVRGSQFRVGALQDEEGQWGVDIDGETHKRAEGRAEAGDLRFLIQGAVLDGLGVTVVTDDSVVNTHETHAELSFGPDRSVVHLRTVPPFSLSVVDERHPTMALGDIRVRAAHGQAYGLQVPEPSFPELASGSSSPVTLTPSLAQAREEEVICFVGSPGYAWKPVPLNLREGGARTIALALGGSLSVSIQGPCPEKAWLRVRAEGKRMAIVKQRALTSRSFDLQGIEEGEVTVSLELGLPSDATVLATRRATIRAGVPQEVVLVPDVIEPESTARLAGELMIPEAWGIEEPALTIFAKRITGRGGRIRVMLRGAVLERLPGESNRWAFDAGELVLGSYVIRLENISYDTAVEVPASGMDTCLVQVPSPTSVSVRVVDPDTMHIARDVEKLSWTPPMLRTPFGHGSQSADVDPISGMFNLMVPGNRVSFDASTYEYSVDGAMRDVTDGAVVDLRLIRYATGSVQLKSGEDRISWPKGTSVRLVHQGGNGRTHMTSSSHRPFKFNVTEPGIYDVHIPEIEGFEPHDPVRVDLQIGEPKDIVVQLTPRRDG